MILRLWNVIALKLSLSLEHYATKESIDIKKLCFKRSSISIEDFTKHIKDGYCFCHWFTTKADTFKIYEKKNDNFDRANVVFVDVDDFNMEMKQFVYGLSRSQRYIIPHQAIFVQVKVTSIVFAFAMYSVRTFWMVKR